MSNSNPPQKRLFCMGYGYTASALARLLKADRWAITGTTRKKEKAEDMRNEGVLPRLWSGGAIGNDWLNDASALLISTPPDEASCPALRALQNILGDSAKHDLEWIGYLSTNGVYGDHDGAWVDETSELRATSARGRRRIAAEEAWRDFAKSNNLPLITFRLPGIYGPGRSAIDAARAGRARRIYKEGQVFSRMHVDDIAAALTASLTGTNPYTLYNLSDDEPAPPQDVVEFACTLIGAPVPPLTPLEEAELSEMGRSFYTDNKRVSNRRMKEVLGVQLRYPTYREGLEAIAETPPGD